MTTAKALIEKVKEMTPGEMSKSDQALALNVLDQCLGLFLEQEQLIQSQKDEINRLQGEQGKPDIAAKNQKEVEKVASADKAAVEDKAAEKERGATAEQGESQPDISLQDVIPSGSSKNRDISSEKERKDPSKKRKKKSVKFAPERKAQRVEKLDFDATEKSKLPADIEFKGYASSRYEDLEIKVTLVEVKRCSYYSPSTGKTYTVPLPTEYEAGSDYTQSFKAHVISLKYEYGMSVGKIKSLLESNGAHITKGTISNILLNKAADLSEEHMAIHQAGMQAGLYEQSDSTSARVNGANQHSHIFTNPHYTAYFTTPHKDRQTILDLLRCNQPRVYLLNACTFSLYAYLKVPEKVITPLGSLELNKEVDQATFLESLAQVLKQEDIQRYQKKLLEGAYLASYQANPSIHILVCDDAPQYKLLAFLIALCWVHIGRHFKKLNPLVHHHQKLLAEFLEEFWQYYHRLLLYKQAPDPLVARQLSTDFDTLFSQQTGYELLDQRIAKTKAKKKELLVVLEHPYVPLHNNDSELPARKEAQYRDVSFQTRNKRGTDAKDLFFTIIQTCKKLDINPYEYIHDRLTERKMMPLQEVILLRAAEMKVSPN